MRVQHQTPWKTAVRRLAAARLISITGGAAAYTALMYTVYERTDSATWLSLTLFLTFGVAGIFAPLGGAGHVRDPPAALILKQTIRFDRGGRAVLDGNHWRHPAGSRKLVSRHHGR